MVRLCSQCGEDVPGDGEECPQCHAPPPRWKPTPWSLRAVLDGFLPWFFTTLGGFLFLFAAFAFCHDWIGPGLGQRVLQIVLGVVVVGVGVPIGLLLLWTSFCDLFVRSWSHPTNDTRIASATTRFGRLISASGGGRTVSDALHVPASGLHGMEAFAHYGVLRRAIPSKYGLANSPARVDLALMVALLALAGQRRVQLRVARSVSWSHRGKAVSRHERTEAVEVRRTDALPAVADADRVESRLLGAMPPPVARVTPIEGPLPYRAAAAVREAGAEATWVRLAKVVVALAAEGTSRRRELREELMAALVPGSELRSTESVCADLVATLEATGEASLGAAIVRQVEQGFAMRDPGSTP